jgi:hypothetical protein
MASQDKVEASVAITQPRDEQIKTAKEVINPRGTIRPTRGTMMRLLRKPMNDIRLK